MSEIGEEEGYEVTAQPILNGTVDPPETLFGSVMIDVNDPRRLGGCSGTLLTNQWVLTAQHCACHDVIPADIDVTYANGSPVTVAEVVQHPSNVDARCVLKNGIYDWAAPPKDQKADLLLLRLSSPISVNGSTTGYHRAPWPRSTTSTVGNWMTCAGFGPLDCAGTPNDSLAAAAFTVNRVEPGSVGQDLLYNRNNAAPPPGFTFQQLQDTCWPDLKPGWPGGQIMVHGDSGGGCFMNGWGSDFIISALATGGYYESMNTALGNQHEREWIALNLFKKGSLSNTGLAAAPAVASPAEKQLDLFWVNTSGSLKWRRYNNGWYSTTRTVTLPSGVSAVGTPAAVSMNQNRTDVFFRSSTNAIYQCTHTGGEPGTWTACTSRSSAGTATSDPGVASWADGRLDLFYRGSANDLQHRWYGGSWAGPEGLGGVLYSAPAAVSWDSGRIDIFVQGGGNAVHQLWYSTTTGWSAWNNLGGWAEGAPAVASWKPGRLDLFTVAFGTVGRLWYEGTWSEGWEFVSSGATKVASAVSWGPGRIDLFSVKAGSTQVWQAYFPR